MRLWIVRHGKAEPSSPLGSDSVRALASHGREQSRWLGRTVAAHADRPRRIVSSPVRRAIETATLINQSVGAEFVQSPLLETGRAASDAIGVVETFADPYPLMIVGHNPTLESVVGFLITGPGAEYEMRTGQAVLLDLRAGPLAGGAQLLEVLRIDDP
jgi:phosphohistidine phosphatase